ncbi:DUF421 domain-containing protein [Hymenobacter tibetensis]|uniref:DUF421 domain-containing protein n=1 Tax=Hymenobacter tibetensis TaxID=497967 RepID=A0ABY4CVS0_9BACT|nr:YetF domain-containing protein [Hymenobacter tibetensis]UOG73079.1 DUF421 domain-containing protein [Hymenobacter tibetensis]
MNTSFFVDLLGLHADASSITTAQVAVRAVLVFCAALAMLRVAGPRTFGRDMAFDLVLKITLGSLLSRAVMAASPLGSTLLACAIFVGLHRLLATVAYHYNWFDWLIKGKSTLLAEEGQLLREKMRESEITEKELLEGLRESASVSSVDQIEALHLERSGKFSVIKKQEN